jgi:cytoskeleton protein RodZ
VEVAAAPELVKVPRATTEVKAEVPPKVTPPKPAVQTVSTIEKVSTEKGETAKVAKPLTGALNRLVIRCEEEAWIEVKDANDRMLVSSLNVKGSERVVKARGALTLVIGNPGQVRVVHNDRTLDLAPHTKAGVARFTLP